MQKIDKKMIKPYSLSRIRKLKQGKAAGKAGTEEEALVSNRDTLLCPQTIGNVCIALLCPQDNRKCLHCPPAPQEGRLLVKMQTYLKEENRD